MFLQRVGQGGGGDLVGAGPSSGVEGAGWAASGGGASAAGGERRRGLAGAAGVEAAAARGKLEE
jgi:hypothetical protein